MRPDGGSERLLPNCLMGTQFHNEPMKWSGKRLLNVNGQMIYDFDFVCKLFIFLILLAVYYSKKKYLFGEVRSLILN